MGRWAVILGLIFLGGCAGCGTPGPAQSFTTHDHTLRQPLTNALVRWSAATGLALRVSHGDVIVEHGELEPPDVGNWFADSREIVLHEIEDPTKLEIVVLHEVGHAIQQRRGRDHVRHGIMQPQLPGNPGCLTPADVALICAGTCRWERPECLTEQGD